MRTALGLLAVLVAVGCHRASSAPVVAEEAGTPQVTRAVPDAVVVAPARFSRPIGAAHAAQGAITFVAGLVVSPGSIALTAIAADGTTRWTREAITGVTWSANATVTVVATPRGAIVVWRGPRAGQDVTLAASFDGEGRPLEDPFAVGAAPCVTDAELAWAERGTKGTWLIKARAFGASTQTTAIAIPEERNPVLLCGAHRIFAFGDGDDDVTLTTSERGVRAPALRVMEDVEFGADDERGHEVFAVGDVVGLVRFGTAGSVAAREVAGDKRGAWRRFGKKLEESDDVTLVDADAKTAILVLTRDGSAGDAASQTSVVALAWDRGGAGDWVHTLAPPDTERARGPFWSGAVAGGIAVGWAERPARADASDAPVLGMAYRVVSGASIGELRRVERPGDDLVDAGCDDARCYAVALARRGGEDGSQPEVAEVITYP